MASIGNIAGPDGELIILSATQRTILMAAEQFLPTRVGRLYIHDAKEALGRANHGAGEHFLQWLREDNIERERKRSKGREGPDKNALGALGKLEIGGMVKSVIDGFTK